MIKKGTNCQSGAKPTKRLEYKSKPSKVVPNMSKTPRQIIEMYASGNPPNIGKRPIWHEHPDFDNYYPNVEKMDITEKEELFNRMRNRIDDILIQQEKLNQEELAKLDKKTKELEAEIADDYKRLKAEEENRKQLKH